MSPSKTTLLAATVCFYSSFVPAQDRSLDEVVVSAARYNSEASISGKFPLPRREIPASVSVLTQQRMEEQNLTTLTEALDQVAGVMVSPNDLGTTGFRSRGYSLGMINDGIPVSQGASGAVQFDNAVYERIEVLRGPNGLFQGSADLGGSINLVSKRPLDTFALESSVGAGSWDGKRLVIDATAPLVSNKAVRARAIGVLDDRDHFTDITETDRQLGYARLDWDVAAATSLSAQFTSQHEVRVGNYPGLPAYSTGRLLRVSRATSISQDWNRNHQDMVDYALTLTHRWNEDWSITARARQRDEDYLYFDAPARGGVNFVDHTQAFGRREFQSELTRRGVDLFALGSFSWLGRTHALTVGYNYDHYDVRVTGFQRWAAAYDVRVPIDQARTVPRLQLPYDQGSGSRREQSGFYLQSRISATDALTLVLGGRLSEFESSSYAHSPTSSSNFGGANREDSHFTPAAGLVYDYKRWLTLYASYADTFVPQSTQFRANGEPLDPSTGRHYEVGAKSQWFDGALQGSISVFDLRHRGRALADPGNPSFFVNDGETESKGWETELVGSLGHGVEVQMSYSRLDTEYLSAAPSLQGKPLSAHDPKHLWKLWAIKRPQNDAANGWTFGAGLNGQSENAFPPRRQGGYALANALLGYRFQRIRINFNANNIFDKVYYTRFGPLYNAYGAPRNYWLTVRVDY